MTAPQILGSGAEGADRTGAGHHLTEEHWQAACDAVTTGGTEADIVRRVALAIADAEDRVRYGSRWCPDCGTHCRTPHQAYCPTGLHAPEETR